MTYTEDLLRFKEARIEALTNELKKLQSEIEFCRAQMEVDKNNILNYEL